MTNRNAEIWSTRLQREILALESSDDESKKIELLPPFITTIGHTLNIDGGIARIEFKIEVEMDENVEDNIAINEVKENKNTEDDTSNSTEKYDQAPNENENVQALTKETQVGPYAIVQNENNKSSTSMTESHVILVLDASMYWKSDQVDNQSKHPTCYPFQKPLAVIKSGAHLFSNGSTIKNGCEIDIDLDWTPSIHLSDAVTNVALKIRECIKRREPLYASRKEDNYDENEGLLSKALMREALEAKESLLETKKAVGAIFSSFSSGIAAKGSSIAAKSQSVRGILSSTLGGSLSSLTDGGIVKQREEVKDQEEEEEEKHVRSGIPSIGEEIDLSEEPWNHCVGMYSCKAIRRPEFVLAAIAEATARSPPSTSASSMFSRFAQSAKSVMEETFLMITDEYIIEFKCNRLNIGSGTVSFAINIEKMAKLKFRREESLSLFFKEAPDDPIVYMCLDSALAVQDIQNVLKRHGVKGKHSNALTQRTIQIALNMVALIQQKEAELIDNPNVDRVNEIMDLYRQAAEKFEQAGDSRHNEVMAHMKSFLNQTFTTSILDGSFVKPEHSIPKNSTMSVDQPMSSAVPIGEILEQPSYNLSNEDDDDEDDVSGTSSVLNSNTAPESVITPRAPKETNDAILQNVEDMLNEAKRDMEDLGMGDDDINNILNSSPSTKAQVSELNDGNDDTFAELDAMLSDADKELTELLNS